MERNQVTKWNTKPPILIGGTRVAKEKWDNKPPSSGQSSFLLAPGWILDHAALVLSAMFRTARLEARLRGKVFTKSITVLSTANMPTWDLRS